MRAGSSSHGTPVHAPIGYRFRLWWTVVAWACTMSAARAQPIEIVDDAGRTVQLPAPASRAVSLAPNLTEFVYAVGAGDRLVGVIAGSDFPAQALDLPRVGDHQTLDVERIVHLQPDLVLVWRGGNPARELAVLERAGLRLAYLEPRSLDGIVATWQRVGRLFGAEAVAEADAARLRAQWQALVAAHQGRQPVRVFYQAWPQPLMTLNDQHLVSDLVRACGGVNVFGHLAPLVPRVGIEEVLAARPDAMLAARPLPRSDAAQGDGPARRDPDHPAWRPWRPYTTLPTVARGALYTVSGDLVSRQGPRVVEGARQVCEALEDARARMPP